MNALQARLAAHPDYRHVVAHAVHPGYVASEIFHELDKKANVDAVGWILTKLLGYVAIDSHQGSLAIANAATGVGFGTREEGSGDGLRGGARPAVRQPDMARGANASGTKPWLSENSLGLCFFRAEAAREARFGAGFQELRSISRSCSPATASGTTSPL